MLNIFVYKSTNLEFDHFSTKNWQNPQSLYHIITESLFISWFEVATVDFVIYIPINTSCQKSLDFIALCNVKWYILSGISYYQFLLCTTKNLHKIKRFSISIFVLYWFLELFTLSECCDLNYFNQYYLSNAIGTKIQIQLICKIINILKSF